MDPTDSTEEPEITPSILANIPECLRNVLRESSKNALKHQRRPILIGSNSLANRFILERWGIRPSQRRLYKTLFSAVRKRSREVFIHYLSKTRIDWNVEDQAFSFSVYKFDEIQDNLIVGFHDPEYTPEGFYHPRS